MPAGGPAARGAVGAVADQRAPGHGLDGRVDCGQRLLLRGVQRVGAGRGVGAVQTQQQPTDAADTSSAAAACTALVWAAATALAKLSAEPMRATSVAAVASVAGNTLT
ncbi:Uncharacterised protein [Mycobacterium tuberculosis]|nr:Uncharacterised protein [Mycobacterium tuberculosis]CME72064.1 Uncharacterised protein [Mycobacterium tuberculosis]CMH90766.1 Uncharacterised protein [Mycobacterium tuberculosis]